MANKPLRPCKQLGCTNLSVNTYCDQHTKQKADYDKHRGTAAQRGYGARWRKARAYYLQRNHTCVKCGELATCIDHIIPHKGNYELFWNQSNWQALCTSCHNRKTRLEDMGGW